MTKKETHSEWVSLREAAQILGVHPTTVRNWTDRGDLPSRRTPGGHRRFRRSDLQQWASTRQTPPSAEAQMIIRSALGQVRLKIVEGQMHDLGWYQRLDERGREEMRVLGRELLEQLEGHLAVPFDATAMNREVKALGHKYASMLISQGLTLKQVLEGFLFFNNFLHEAILQVVEITSVRASPECTILLRQAQRFTNTMLLSLAEAYEDQV